MKKDKDAYMTDHKAAGIQALKEMHAAGCDINIVLTHSRTGVLGADF